MGLGGVSIVQEFLNIWDDLRKHYVDNYSKLEAVQDDKNDGARKEKKVKFSLVPKNSGRYS